MTTSHTGLSRKSVGTAALVFLSVSASAPMTVLGGGVITTFAATGVLGVPLSFVILIVPLLLVSVGLVAMGRDVPHAAAFYAFLAQGISRAVGVAGASVALVSYNALQIGLYGLFGASAAAYLGGTWWVWALGGWAIVGLLGVRHIEINTRVVAVVLAVEIAVIALFIVAALAHPAAGLRASVTPLLPGSLLVDGVGGVLALSVAAFVGFESVVVYGEEVTNARSVRRAALGVVTFLGIFYAVASWALIVVVGPDQVVDATRDPNAGLPFSVLDHYFGPLVGAVGIAMLLLSVLSAMISFHNVVARYVFGLAREGVLPTNWATTGGGKGGVPIGGSLAQSVTAVVVIVAFVLSGADPVTVMFTTLTTIAAIGVLALLAGASAAVVAYYARAVRRPSSFQWLVAPLIGCIALTAILIVTVTNIATVTGDTADTALQWILPGLILAAAAAGVAWSAILHRVRPGAWSGIGRGSPRPLAVLDGALAHLEL